jgi:broad specificity phosphatase PhoE
MALIYLVRHGESTWNVERRWAGHANPPLSAVGREQTFVACELLAGMGFDGIVSSSLLRARETAEIIATQLKLPLHNPLPNFDERHAGEISGLTSGEIEMKFPGLLGEWRQGNPIEIPGGELWALFTKRVLQGFAHFKDYDAKRILLISHEGVLRAVAYHLKEPHKKHGNLQGRWLEWGRPGLLSSINSK